MEDFTTYTETDASARIAVTSTKLTITAIQDSETGRVVKDKGAAFFNADYEHWLTVYIDSATVTGIAAVIWAVANTSTGNIAGGGMGNDANWIRAYEETASTASIFLCENDGGVGYTNTVLTLSLSTPYYLKIKRDEAVGSFGTLYCYIYSDSGRTTLVTTLSIALHTSKKDYQYIYGFTNWQHEDGAYTWTGYVENLDIAAGASPGPANLKSYNTNLKANIKSINTNPIANIKSLNTNV